MDQWKIGFQSFAKTTFCVFSRAYQIIYKKLITTPCQIKTKNQLNLNQMYVTLATGDPTHPPDRRRTKSNATSKWKRYVLNYYPTIFLRNTQSFTKILMQQSFDFHLHFLTLGLQEEVWPPMQLVRAE